MVVYRYPVHREWPDTTKGVINITKKDYIKIADIIKLAITDSEGDFKDHAMDTLIDRLCFMFKEDNKLFDRDRFINYIRG